MSRGEPGEVGLGDVSGVSLEVSCPWFTRHLGIKETDGGALCDNIPFLVLPLPCLIERIGRGPEGGETGERGGDIVMSSGMSCRVSVCSTGE